MTVQQVISMVNAALASGDRGPHAEPRLRSWIATTTAGCPLGRAEGDVTSRSAAGLPDAIETLFLPAIKP